MASKPVTDLVPGDVLPGQPRIVEKVERTATAVVATFTDGRTETWALDGNPSVELADG